MKRDTLEDNRAISILSTYFAFSIGLRMRAFVRLKRIEKFIYPYLYECIYFIINLYIYDIYMNM